jgi:hypothetical protein
MVSGRAANSSATASATVRGTRVRALPSSVRELMSARQLKYCSPSASAAKFAITIRLAILRFGTTVQGGGQHNVVASGGWVLSF